MTNFRRSLVTAASALVLTLCGPALAPASAGAATTAPATSHPAPDLVRTSVAPSECSTPVVEQYLAATLAQLSPEQSAFLAQHQLVMLTAPTFDALAFGTEGNPDYALDARAAQLRNTFRDVKKFWAGSEDANVDFDDIQLVGMHGDTLTSPDRLRRTLTTMSETGFLPPMTTDQISAEVTSVTAFMADNPGLVDSPLWTLNAFAFTTDMYPTLAGLSIPDKVVFGDGLLAMLDTLGLADVGPRVVMGHEFAHHIQLELGLYDSYYQTPPAELPAFSRRVQLMADAMAAYYGVHKRGLALNSKRVVDTLVTFASVGDCAFENPGHHGTPLQRERAAIWGAELASSAKPKSAILDAREVVQRFDAAPPSLL